MAPVIYNLKRVIEKASCGIITHYYLHQAKKYFDIKIQGLDNLPETSAFVVPNHCLFIDGILLHAVLHRFGKRQNHFWIQNENVYERPSLKAFLWAQGQIPVNVDRQSSNKAVFRRTAEYLKWSSDLIAVFAEGPTKDLIDGQGNILPIPERLHYKGAAMSAVKNNVPIVPIALRSCDELEIETWKFGLTRGKSAKDFMREYVSQNGKPPYYVNIGKPVYPDTILRHKEAIEQLSDRVRKSLVELAMNARD